jgi:16S rRNA (adenine1518-N6/adenine1519-N6)-dimethyltransferase
MPSKPKLGQNFLRDSQAVERIAAALGDLSCRTVIEIGPGAGAITGALAARSRHVIAVEFDHDLALHLRVQFPADKVTVVEQDVLNFDFAAALAEHGSPGEKFSVVGNLPYYITSPILFKLAASHAALDVAVLMVQREVADRITAQPGTHDYSVLSVTTQVFGPVTSMFTLPPESFSPPPDVHSTVFRWRFAPRFAELDIQEVPFLRFVRMAFAQKRKTLSNNLRAAGYAPAEITAALHQVGIPPQARAETLSIESFAALAKIFSPAEPPVSHAQ